MAEGNRSGSASRAQWLEMKREREVVEEGHRFLDEKRVLLAREMLDRLAKCAERRTQFETSERDAHAALERATGRLGLEQIQVHPPLDAGSLELETGAGSFLGVRLPQPELKGGPPEAGEVEPVVERNEIAVAADHFAGLFDDALALATDYAALLRLEAEYQRTQRRVRALEKIILPEMRADERTLENALEELELEEAVRVRLAAHRD